MAICRFPGNELRFAFCKGARFVDHERIETEALQFDRGGDPYRQRQVVTERLAEFVGMLPQGVGAPLLSSPDAPELQKATAALLVLFLIGATWQVLKLRRGTTAAPVLPVGVSTRG